VLEVQHLQAGARVSDVSFCLLRGEILGFAGLIGAGRTEMAEALMGLRPASCGRVRLLGHELPLGSLRHAVHGGLGYLSEDRQRRGLIMEFDVPSNITLGNLRRYGRVFVARKRERARARTYAERFAIRAASMTTRLRFLSGGNQQKVYLSKSLDTEPQVLILDEPTRGVDVAAKQQVYQFTRSLVDRGLSCVLISSELEELIGMCSRVYVMREGRIAGELTGDRVNEEDIMLLATGAAGRGAG
jgi:ribose transport system ATP-binding protein